jgi:hypothetical protein
MRKSHQPSAEECRLRACELRRIAERRSDPETRRQLFQLAGEWDLRAAHCEPAGPIGPAPVSLGAQPKAPARVH